MQDKQAFRSKLKIARGLGSAHHGAHHWWLERITSLGLIPLCLWFMVSLLSHLLSPDAAQLYLWLESPFNVIALILMLLLTFIHTKLGFQAVIEDYIKCPCKKYASLILNSFACYGAMAIGILAVLKMHLAG